MLLGDSEIAVVGGAESMTNAPLLLNKSKKHDKNPVYQDSLMIDGIGDAYSEKPMGITAENVADKYRVTRQDMDEFARDSHAKAYACLLYTSSYAMENGMEIAKEHARYLAPSNNDNGVLQVLNRYLDKN